MLRVALLLGIGVAIAIGAGTDLHALATGFAAGVVAFVITDSIRRGRRDRG